LIDANSNQRISAKSPTSCLKEFEKSNGNLLSSLKSHLIDDPETFGLLDDDYDLFIRKRSMKIA